MLYTAHFRSRSFATLCAALLAAATILGCGGQAVAIGDAGSAANDTGTPTDTGHEAANESDACPPPDLAPGDCVMCNDHVYCGAED
jgi:hypothetical protein